MSKDIRFLPIEEHEPLDEIDEFEGLDEFLESRQKRSIAKHKDRYSLYIAS